MLVDDGKDTDPRLYKVFSEDELKVKEGDLIVINSSDDGKMFFFRKLYEDPNSSKLRTANT